MEKIIGKNIILPNGLTLDSELSVVSQKLEIIKQIQPIHIYNNVTNRTLTPSTTEPIVLQDARFNVPCDNVIFDSVNSAYTFRDGISEVEFSGILHLVANSMPGEGNVRTYVILGYSNDDFETYEAYNDLTMIDNRILPSGSGHEYLTPFMFKLNLTGVNNNTTKFRLYTNSSAPSGASIGFIRRSLVNINCYPESFR